MARPSTGSYPLDWAKIALRTKEAAGWECRRCGRPHDIDTGYMLTVHHLDLDKSNCRWWNLVALCQRCHLHIQGKVVMERPWMFEHSEWFRPYVAGYYAHRSGLDDSRDYVMAHLEKLLKSS
jgi:5-methylcytosine-specific restriction endonuclease McrA